MGSAPGLVIAGASYAGVQLAASARELGYDGRIVLVGDEARMPYQRPPLSKGLLTGKTSAEQLALRGEAFYAENRIELRLGERVLRVEPASRRLVLADGSVLAYDSLALATGARGRALAVPGASLENVAFLRTLDDALHIAQAAERVRSVCIIGGGFIGLEVASALATRGIDVTVVEAQERLLARSVPPLISEFVAAAHRQRGVRVLCGRGVARLLGSSGVQAVELADGERVECELVVAGIGVLPNAELAAGAGLATGNGILVDALGRTSVPHVLAAGDCACMPSAYARTPGQPVRLESIQAANDGARAAASVIAGRERPCTSVPWFWSDQYELKFQMAGLADSADEIVTRGLVASGRFTAFFLRDGVIAAAHSVGRPGEHMTSRKLIAAKARAGVDQLADESFDLKTIPVLPPTLENDPC